MIENISSKSVYIVRTYLQVLPFSISLVSNILLIGISFSYIICSANQKKRCSCHFPSIYIVIGPPYHHHGKLKELISSLRIYQVILTVWYSFPSLLYLPWYLSHSFQHFKLQAPWFSDLLIIRIINTSTVYY